jgi:putative queuosine salvage protein
MARSLPDQVRAACAGIAASARSVRIDPDRLAALDPGPLPEMDAERHYLEGEPADVAAYVLTLDAINFGSGWFPTLRKRRGPDGRAVSGYFTVSWGLADRFRALGPWTNGELRAMRTEEVADVLGQPPGHELMALFAQALRQLGAFLGDRSALDVVAAADGSAVRLAEMLAGGMSMFADHGFYKRAQITASDLELAGIASFGDIDRLTIFADNLVPHVLRCDGVLVYDERLAAHIDAGRPLRPGPQEREIRACAVHACALLAGRTGMTERDIDNALWTRGGAPEYKAVPRHRCRTIFY